MNKALLEPILSDLGPMTCNRGFCPTLLCETDRAVGKIVRNMRSSEIHVPMTYKQFQHLLNNSRDAAYGVYTYGCCYCSLFKKQL